MSTFGEGILDEPALEAARELKTLTAGIASNLRDVKDLLDSLPGPDEIARRVSRLTQDLVATGASRDVVAACGHLLHLLTGSTSPYRLVMAVDALKLDAIYDDDPERMAANVVTAIETIRESLLDLGNFESLRQEAAKSLVHAADLIAGRGVQFRLIQADAVSLDSLVRLDPVALAADAYLAYGQAVEFKNFRGDPMPAWQELPEQIRSAWAASVKAVLNRA